MSATVALCQESRTAPADERLPLPALIALALAAFITMLTETLPAGLLPQIGASLGVAEALAGQLVTCYALGSLVAAIPLTVATQGMRRRPLLLLALGFCVMATVIWSPARGTPVTLM